MRICMHGRDTAIGDPYSVLSMLLDCETVYTICRYGKCSRQERRFQRVTVREVGTLGSEHVVLDVKVSGSWNSKGVSI